MQQFQSSFYVKIKKKICQILYAVQSGGMECFAMKKYVCSVCGYVYDPAVGDPDNGIAAGTAWEDLPEDFVCPLCGVGKDQFEEE